MSIHLSVSLDYWRPFSARPWPEMSAHEPWGQGSWSGHSSWRCWPPRSVWICRSTGLTWIHKNKKVQSAIPVRSLLKAKTFIDYSDENAHKGDWKWFRIIQSVAHKKWNPFSWTYHLIAKIIFSKIYKSLKKSISLLSCDIKHTTVKPRPEAHMGMIPPEALLKGIGLIPQQQTLQQHYLYYR